MSAPNNFYISGCSTDKPAGHSSCYFSAALGAQWDMDGQLHTLEFVTSKSNRDDLWNNIIPGKVDEWDFPFDKTYYIDTTYYSGNTIKVEPVAGTHLDNIRDTVKLVVKEYREELWGRPADRYLIRLSGYKYESL